MHRPSQQLAFIVEIDRLKRVLRRTWLCDHSRPENSAEHSWHLATMAVLLAEHADPMVDIARVTRMVLVHDIVEIDAGDTYAYDDVGNGSREARERAAADRLFALLPEDQGAQLRALWEEFEVRQTVDARYAAALDRLQPLLNNDRSGGGSWRTHHVTRDQVLERMEPIQDALPAFWPTVLEIVDRNCVLGNIGA